MESRTVKEIMQKKVITIDESKSIQEAAEIMTKYDVGCVIITKDDKPIGILTESDFARFASKGTPLFTEISRSMSFPLITIEVEQTVLEAAKLMSSNRIHKLPVQDGKKMVGIVTDTDLVKICSSASDSKMRRASDQVLMRTGNKTDEKFSMLDYA